jgi:hypothetical protein
MFVFAGLAWALWNARNKMAMEKQFPRRPTDAHICCCFADAEVPRDAGGSRKQDDPTDGIHLHQASLCVLANDFSLAANPSNTLNPYFMASLKAEIYLLKNVVSKKSPKKCVYILKLCIRISAAI